MSNYNRTECLFKMLPIDFTLQDSLRAKLYKFKSEYNQDCSVCNRKYYNNIFYKDQDGTFFKCLNCLFTDITGTQITEDPHNFKGQIIDFIINPNSSFGEVFKPAQGEGQKCSICKINTSWLFLNTVRNNLPICLTCYANSTNIPYKVLPFTVLPQSINVEPYHPHILYLQKEKNKDIQCSCNLSHGVNTRFKCGAWYECDTPGCNYKFCLNCYILLYPPDGDNTNVMFGDCKCSLNHDENAGLSFKRPLKKVSKKSPRKSARKSPRKSRKSPRKSARKSSRNSRKSPRKSRKSSRKSRKYARKLPKKSVRKSRKRSKLQSK